MLCVSIYKLNKKLKAMRNYKFYLTMFAVLLMVSFTTKAESALNAPPLVSNKVFDIISNSPVHNTLETAIIAAELDDDLQGAGPFTVFAPTDAAFDALPPGTLAALLADIPALTDILLYHVVGAKAMSSDLSFGQSIETLLGKNVTVVFLNGNVYINNALVTVADLEADNGVVHVIDAVLLPPASLPATVMDIISGSPVHRDLDFALSAAGLDDDLQGAGPFTVFAPTDAAFEALPAGLLDELLANPQELANILLYHAVGAKALSSSLTNGQKIKTLFGKNVTVTINANGVFINNAKVTVVDLEAENGVVHVIDAVLVPSADVKIAETASKGKVITDSNGRTLYFFARDAKGTSLCTGGCLNNWPIFYAENILAGAGLNPADFGTIDRGSGVMQTTYKGWPLYYHVNDTEPGNMNGEGLIGRWFVAKPDYSIMIVDNQLTGLNGVNYKGDYTPGDEVIQYFTDEKGVTLYTRKLDNYNLNKFTRPDFSNNGVWPIYEETEIIIPSVLNSADFGVINVHGRNQLTYKGWPLYYFGQDMMVRGNNKGVSVPVPGTWPVPVKDMKSPKYSTVVDIIVNSPVHNTLETAVIAAGLVETLQGPGPFTVFAPTDAAFAALPEGTLEALLGDIPALTNILTYHVVGAKAMSSDLSNGQKIVTIQGKEVIVTINADGVFINNAKVTVSDLEAENGVVHVIDAVLIPSAMPATVVDIIVNSPDHNTLEAAVIAAGLVETLQGPGPFTVFAPTDAAFAALPEGTLEALLADIPALTNILLYHAVGAKAMSSDLSNGQKIVTVQGKEVIVTINDEGVFINNAKVTVVDLQAENGVVHVIDAVLIPSSMPATVVDIIVNSPDHNTLEAAVIAAGLVETLQGPGPFTVFAPTDAAFAALPIGAINELLEDPTGALTDILLYHVVGAKAMSSDLSDGQTITTVLGKDVKVTINADGVFINNAKVTVVDLEAENGVVHVIDAVLIPVDKATFPIDFETKTDAVWEVFANGAGAEDDFMVIVNPDLTGINTSDNVLKFKVNDGADPWAGAFSNSYAPVEFTEEMNKVTMMVWKSVISPVAFKVEASTNGGPVTEVKVSNTVTNQWEKLTFDMSALVGYSYDRIVIFPDFPNTRTSGTTVYVDNIQLEKKTTVVDIIVNSDAHNTLEAAVVAAGLVETLQGPGPFTVFAPTDAAFAALPEGTIEALLADIPALTNILLYHVVGAKAMSSDLSNGQKIVTVQGKEVTVTINADGVFINNAKVTVADLEADNGVVHVIDAVLLPTVDKAAFPIDFETMTDAVWEVFANGAGAEDDFMVIANPDKAGINTSDNVLKFKVNNGADPWAGAFSDSYAPVEFTENSHIVTMMVWKSVISPVAFKVEASTNGGPVTEVKVSNTLTNQWEKLTFDLSALVGYSYNRIVIFPDFPNTRTSGTTVYIDNIEKVTALPETVVDIIVNSADHNTLEAAVISAGLVETLQGPGPFTVFAPTDAAFAALPEGTLEALLGDIPALTNILLYHVVGAKAMSSDLSNGQKIVTAQGKEVTVTINADGVFINNAKVTVADLEAENGVVHVIDAVLIPTTTNISRLDELTFDIYPNPATDYIRINSNIGIESLIIRDITGRVVTQMNNLSSSERIELNGFKSGMYLVTMKNGNSVSTKKLIVR
jgi:uncharacterized surface protein with fasciclin (FAS1) repeats